MGLVSSIQHCSVEVLPGQTIEIQMKLFLLACEETDVDVWDGVVPGPRTNMRL